MTETMDIFLVAIPGLEQPLEAEARALGFSDIRPGPGGVTISGGWPDVWRANLELRGASKVLARIGGFRAMHLAQLDKRMRKFPWADVLRPDVPVRVEATSHASRIYHAGAAAARVSRAIAEELGAPISTDAADEGAVVIKIRIDDDFCAISLDTSGVGLHKRGHKAAVNKAPMRETMAAALLSMCGYRGDMPVVDPMCGSGTFIIEAAEIALGLQPGRSRDFAFERLANADPMAVAALRRTGPLRDTALRFHGSDRDGGAVAMSRKNAESAGVAGVSTFTLAPISDLARPEGPPGLVIINPPYGGRIGDKRPLYGLYGAMGQVLRDRFSGWKVGIVTTEAGLAQASGLPFLPPSESILHGGLKVRLWRTEALA